MAETPKKPKFVFNYRDVLALIGLGLLGWGLHRLGGRTVLIFFMSFLLLAWSGLVHTVVKYIEFHIVNSLRLIFHKLENVPAVVPTEKG